MVQQGFQYMFSKNNLITVMDVWIVLITRFGQLRIIVIDVIMLHPSYSWMNHWIERFSFLRRFDWMKWVRSRIGKNNRRRVSQALRFLSSISSVSTWWSVCWDMCWVKSQWNDYRVHKYSKTYLCSHSTAPCVTFIPIPRLYLYLLSTIWHSHYTHSHPQSISNKQSKSNPFRHD